MTNGISEECARKIVLEEALPAVNKALGVYTYRMNSVSPR